jgi:hypothetical protein
MSPSQGHYLHRIASSSFLGSTAQLRPWPPPQNSAEFLGGFSTNFYRVGLLAPRPTPIPDDHASVFISPRGRVATHFSRLLRHAWVTVGLFLFPGHHTGNTGQHNTEKRGHRSMPRVGFEPSALDRVAIGTGAGTLITQISVQIKNCKNAAMFSK